MLYFHAPQLFPICVARVLRQPVALSANLLFGLRCFWSSSEGEDPSEDNPRLHLILHVAQPIFLYRRTSGRSRGCWRPSQQLLVVCLQVVSRFSVLVRGRGSSLLEIWLSRWKRRREGLGRQSVTIDRKDRTWLVYRVDLKDSSHR